ncbi:MAG: NUDIX domain-containing protein [Candidatus Daviesbacteria bacterium]|nr:NUDIX domain-containing protein [Candidatus Daviesbacteria bacterium]
MAEIKGAWTALFLIDQNPPTEVVVLKRSPDKKFAPNKYTGIGGTVEDGETPLDCQLRELKEETGLSGIAVTEFARAIIDDVWHVHYYWGIFNGDLPECNEGFLQRVSTNVLPNLDFTETSKGLIKQWHKRGFQTNSTWTMYTKKLSSESNAPEELLKVIERLS